MKRKPIPSYIKKLVHQIYSHCCGRCGNDFFLHIHHKDRNPSNNEIENLELLCCWCHWAEHDYRDDILEWILKRI